MRIRKESRTLAWYKVDSSVNVATTADAYSVTSAASTVSIGTVSVTVTLTPGGSVELLNSAGKTGAVVGGNVVTTDPSGASTKYVQTITASAVFASEPTAEQYAALKGKTWTGHFTAKGNAKLVASATSYADPGSELTGTFTISFKAADGTINATNVTANGYFKINTNNEEGAEYKVADADTAPKGQVPTAYSASATYAVGDVVLQDSKVYKCKTAIGTAETFNEEKWTRIDHGADQLVVTADAGSAVGA